MSEKHFLIFLVFAIAVSVCLAQDGDTPSSTTKLKSSAADFKRSAEKLRESSIQHPVPPPPNEPDPFPIKPFTPEEKALQERLKKATKDIDEALEKKACIMRAEVINMADDGALVRAKFWEHAKPNQSPDKYYKQPVFIYGIPQTLVDGDVWKGKVYPSGNYRYITTIGSRATVIGFATTKELAIQHLR